MLYILPILLLNAGACLASCAHGTYLHRRGTNRDEPDLPDFDYGPVRGPTYWHCLSSKNFLCAVGRTQSPIDIDDSITVKQPGTIDMEVPVQEAEVLNLGTTVEVVLEGTALIDGTEFELQQYHIHTPSEHWIHGKHYAMEIHMVHAAKGDPTSLAVVALLVQPSSTQSLRSLEDVISHSDAILEPGSSAEIQNLNIADMMNVINAASFYHYTGSLTTPPCTEGVEFFIAQDPVSLRAEAYNDLRSVQGFNARFVQSSPPAKKNVLVRAAGALRVNGRQNGSAYR